MPKRRSSVQAGGRGRRDLVSKRRGRRDGRWVYATIIPAAVPRLLAQLQIPSIPSQIPDGEIAMRPESAFMGKHGWTNCSIAIRRPTAPDDRRSFWTEVAWHPNATDITRAAVGDRHKQKMKWMRQREAGATTQREWIKSGYVAATVDGGILQQLCPLLTCEKAMRPMRSANQICGSVCTTSLDTYQCT